MSEHDKKVCDIDNQLLKNKKNEVAKIKVTDSKQVDEFLKSANQFEEDTIAIAKKNAKVAWRIAGVFAVVACLCLIAVISLLPLKESVPFILRVDNATGETSILRPLDQIEVMTHGEVLDKYWLNTFIIARNGYMWETVQNSYDTVQMMSSLNVFSDYQSAMLAKNSPTNEFGDDKRIRIEVKDIVFLPSAVDGNQLIAQISFGRIVENANGSQDNGYKPTNWKATVTYDYQALITTNKERIINPLEFRVTSYREDRNLNR